MVVTQQVVIHFLFFWVGAMASAWVYAQDHAIAVGEPRLAPFAVQPKPSNTNHGVSTSAGSPGSVMARGLLNGESSAHAMGYALYQSVQNQQWAQARQILSEYQTLPNHDPMLVYHVQGALAREQGQLAQAETAFRGLLTLKPDFLPARLELARILFEDMQEHEAEQIFSDIFVSINPNDPKTAGVRRTIEAYLANLKQRQAWTGSVSLGPLWSDNINRTSASQVCLLSDPSGFCFYERALPPKVRATGGDLDASLQRYFPLYGHQGGYIRALLNSVYWSRQEDFNETTAAVQAGYSYRNARQEITFAPSFEYYLQGGNALYHAWGVHGGWSYILSPRALMKLEADYKWQQYNQADYARNFDGPISSVSATYFQGVGAGWTLFGGLDFVSNTAKQAINSYQQTGGRMGVSLQSRFGWIGSLFASYRHRNYGTYNPLVDAQRRDNEQIYTLVLKVPRWQIRGFVPSLTLRHQVVRSNVDWLYSYKRNDISRRLEYIF